MKSPIISIIVSVDEERGIGKEGKIPWYIPEDLMWFKEKTLGHVVIMGQVTYESIIKRLKKPLPDRINIVVNKDEIMKDNFKNVLVVNSIEKAINLAKKKEKKGEVFIIGGGQIYKQTIDIANRLYLTKIKGKYNADTFFPDYSQFRKEIYSKKVNNGKYDFEFMVLEK